MNFIQTDGLLWSIIGAITIAATFFAFSEYIFRFIRFIFKRSTQEKQICYKIYEWFYYIDKNLEKENFDLEELYIIEEQIFFLFKMKGNPKLIMNFNNRFIKKYLHFCGLQEQYYNKANFLKFSHIHHLNLELSLQLASHIHKKEFNQFYMPFSSFWGILCGNFHQFYQQYKNDYKDVMENEKLTFADIQMPVKVIKIYYNVY
jgi:hypothetical protein